MPKKQTTAQNKIGSPPVGEPEYLVVGFLRRPHGVRGEMLMDVHTDFPERIKPGITYFVGESHQQMTLASRRPHHKGMLVRFRGVKTPEDAGLYRNQWVYVTTASRPELPEGEYYHHQLIGLNVLDENDTLLGELVDIIETGANDVYIVRDKSGRELLLPAIPAVILDVQLADRQMRVHLLDGLA
ncbi:MAG: ribosome maturation factor RimM [Anaerolineales bacterium]